MHIYTNMCVYICTHNLLVDISFPITQTMKRVKIFSRNWSLPHIQKDGLILVGMWPQNSEELESYLKLFIVVVKQSQWWMYSFDDTSPIPIILLQLYNYVITIYIHYLQRHSLLYLPTNICYIHYNVLI